MAKKQVKKWQTAKGESVPAAAVSAYDKKKETVVTGLVAKAYKLSQALEEFKQVAYSHCDKLYAQRLKEKGVEASDRKGNFTIYNYDRSMKIEMNVSEGIKFNDDIVLAQEKINAYLDEVTEDANEDLRVIVRNAFTARRGQIDRARILSLFRYQIKNPIWLEAIELIKSSIEVTDSKRYVSFYVRDDEGVYLPVSLNFASL